MDTHARLVSTAATRRTVIAAGAATVVTVAAPDSYRPPRLRGARLATWRRESYVLVFSTRATLEQGTWSLRARRSGRFRMFLVPGADRGKRTAVTATFNGWRG